MAHQSQSSARHMAAGPHKTTRTAPRTAPRHMAAPAASGAKAPEKAQPAAKQARASKSSPANVGRSAAMMSGLVIISRITGFFRTWGQAYALGVTMIASCYTVANNLPNQLYELVMGGMLITAFLPVYMSVKEKSGRAGANRYASNLVSLVVILMGALALLGFVFAGQVVWTQSFSATADFDFDLTIYFFRFFVIEVVLYALSSIVSGVLNAEREYFWSNAAPIFNNFVCTASFLLYAAFMDTQPAFALLCLALGNPLGVAIQVVMQLPALHKLGIKIRPYVDLHDPALKETLSIGIPSLVVTGASFVTYSVQTSSALSVTVSGSSIAYYARLWYTLPYAILAIPITTAMFTELSEAVSHNDMAAYKRGVSAGSSQIMFLLVPFALYLIVFATPLISLLGAGRFSAQDVAATVQYLQCLALALPAYGICTYLQKVCSSLRRMNVFAWASIIAGAIQIAMCLLFTDVVGLNNVALSSLFFFVAVDVVTYWHLRKTLGNMGLKTVAAASLRALALGLAGAAVGAGVLVLLTNLVAPLTGSVLQALVYIVAGGIPSVLVTFGLALAFHVPESALLTQVLRHVVKRLCAR